MSKYVTYLTSNEVDDVFKFNNGMHIRFPKIMNMSEKDV